MYLTSEKGSEASRNDYERSDACQKTSALEEIFPAALPRFELPERLALSAPSIKEKIPCPIMSIVSVASLTRNNYPLILLRNPSTRYHFINKRYNHVNHDLCANGMKSRDSSMI